MHRSIRLVSEIALIAGLLCCARPPERELTEAQQAIEQARAVEADLYATDTYQEAEDKLASARTQIELEQERSVASRSYDDAKQLLASAKQAAHRAFYEASSGRKEARESATEVIREAHAALETAKASVAKAPANRGTEGDIAALKMEVDALEATLADAERELEVGHYRKAYDIAESVVAEARRIKQDVARALRQST